MSLKARWVFACLGLAVAACEGPLPSELASSADSRGEPASGALAAVGGRGELAQASVLEVVGGGNHSCALVEGGRVFCWGENLHGQLGDGTRTDRVSPVPVLQAPGGQPLTGVQAIALGQQFSCALLGGGEVRCWGRNDTGQLGDGTQSNRQTPVPVLDSPGGQPLAGVQTLALGAAHACALLPEGQARCWGSNHFGQLGDGSAVSRPTPVSVLPASGAPSSQIQSISLGYLHSCALFSGGDVRCWGYNFYGQLGDGTQTDRSTPAAVQQSPGEPSLTGATSIALGGYHSCARLGSGEVRCWGRNISGELGNGSTASIQANAAPVRKSPGGAPLAGVQALGLGFSHSCALVEGGSVLCWGSNHFGELGAGTSALQQPTPSPVFSSDGAPLTGVTALALGELHTCARQANGTTSCWGQNMYGQLGDGTKRDQVNPVALQPMPNRQTGALEVASDIELALRASGCRLLGAPDHR